LHREKKENLVKIERCRRADAKFEVEVSRDQWASTIKREEARQAQGV
jgi:hypothetical protein